MNPSADRQSSIAMAVQSPFESTGVPLQVNWQDITGTGDKKTVNFLLHVAANGFTVEESNKNAFDVDLVAVAMQDGKQTDDIGQTLQGSMPPEMLAKIQSGGLSYRNHLQLAAGNYTVRFVVRDNLSGKIGSVTAPLTVN
jgi:hypothetical protein